MLPKASAWSLPRNAQCLSLVHVSLSSAPTTGYHSTTKNIAPVTDLLVGFFQRLRRGFLNRVLASPSNAECSSLVQVSLASAPTTLEEKLPTIQLPKTLLPRRTFWLDSSKGFGVASSTGSWQVHQTRSVQVWSKLVWLQHPPL